MSCVPPALPEDRCAEEVRDRLCPAEYSQVPMTAEGECSLPLLLRSFLGFWGQPLYPAPLHRSAGSSGFCSSELLRLSPDFLSWRPMAAWGKHMKLVTHLLLVDFKKAQNLEARYLSNILVSYKLCCREHPWCVCHDDNGCLGYFLGNRRLLLLKPLTFYMWWTIADISFSQDVSCEGQTRIASPPGTFSPNLKSLWHIHYYSPPCPLGYGFETWTNYEYTQFCKIHHFSDQHPAPGQKVLVL